MIPDLRGKGHGDPAKKAKDAKEKTNTRKGATKGEGETNLGVAVYSWCLIRRGHSDRPSNS